MTRMLFHCTHGRDDPERAIVPFIAANVAAASGQEAVVLLTIEGAWLCQRGYADTVKADGFPDLAGLVASFVEAGGQIWGCSACTTPRGITEADLVSGAQIVGAATIVAAVADGRCRSPWVNPRAVSLVRHWGWCARPVRATTFALPPPDATLRPELRDVELARKPRPA